MYVFKRKVETKDRQVEPDELFDPANQLSSLLQPNLHTSCSSRHGVDTVVLEAETADDQSCTFRSYRAEKD